MFFILALGLLFIIYGVYLIIELLKLIHLVMKN